MCAQRFSDIPVICKGYRKEQSPSLRTFVSRRCSNWSTLSLTLANSHRLRGMRNIGSLSMIS